MASAAALGTAKADNVECVAYSNDAHLGDAMDLTFLRTDETQHTTYYSHVADAGSFIKKTEYKAHVTVGGASYLNGIKNNSTEITFSIEGLQNRVAVFSFDYLRSEGNANQTISSKYWLKSIDSCYKAFFAINVTRISVQKKK